MVHNSPIPQPDELAHGILGRFATSNAMSSISVARKTLKVNFRTEKFEPTFSLLAKALEIDPIHFANNHSLIPALFPFSQSPAIELNRIYRLALTHGLPGISDFMAGCQACIQHDQNTIGSDYWHRIHQITGVEWCIKHSYPLFYVPSNQAIHPPGQAITSGKIGLEPGQLHAELQYPVINRFQTILANWLYRQDRIYIPAWNNVVSQACRSHNLRTSQVGKKAVVSDLIQQQFPPTWLARHLPEVLTKHSNVFVHKVDGACKDKHVAYPALVCAAILAVLFVDAKQALQELDNTNRQFLSHQKSLSIVTENHHALSAFISGASLAEACAHFNAEIHAVEAEIRDGYKLYYQNNTKLAS